MRDLIDIREEVTIPEFVWLLESMCGTDYEWLEIVETPQKSLHRVMDENAPVKEGWEHVHTKYYEDSSNRVVEIGYIFRRKK